MVVTPTTNTPENSLASEAFQLFAVVMISIFVFLPAYHYFLSFIPGIPPERVYLRAYGSIPALISFLLLLFFPSLRRYLGIAAFVGVSACLVMIHQLVIESGNHYTYLSSGAIGYFGCQFAFSKQRSLAITYGFCFLSFLYQILTYGPELESFHFSIGYHFSGYFIGYVMGYARIRARDRERMLRDRLQIAEKEALDERARSFNQAKLATLGTMAGGVAHEVNNPLAVIALTTRGLKKLAGKITFSNEDHKEQMVESVDSIQEMTERISIIIKGLKVLSSYEGSKEIGNLVLKKSIDEVVQVFQARCHEKKITLEVLPFRDDLKVSAIEAELYQVLYNIISNSIDAVEESAVKKITLEVTTPEPSRVNVAIRDTGPGLPELIKEHLFEPFYSTKGIGKGMGMGLSVSRSMARGWRGDIVFDGMAQETTFIVSLRAV